ncbi:flagellar basal-body MS-ring/collar protein FliF [Rhodobaculum claviforme]|nr:flagellar basal-body MS-ring/collar protein FliF [Rhodobaculum claviforme]
MPIRRQAIVAGAAIAVFIAVLGLARLAAQPGMSLLYAGVDGPAAGEMVQMLDARNIRYEVRGDAIYVPTAQRDETRMMLAGQGLPSAGGGRGYELLDGLSGFGTTAQMFDAAYWRAKEGELARTIVASPAIRAARVHIAHTSTQPFRREIAPTASVTVTPASGGLPAGQARALRFLVASAVPGLTAENVAVIDGTTGTVIQSEDGASAMGPGSDREGELRAAVQRILEAHVGRGRAIVELSVETVTESESIRERRLDPEGRVPILLETEERSSTSSDTHNAGVTVASNLPDGDANADGGRSQSQSAETRERQNFDVSELSREVHRAPGAIRRITVAALVDGVTAPDETGTPVWAPRGTAELEALHDLIAAAVGYDAERGDVISLKSLPLSLPAAEGTTVDSTLFGGLPLDTMTLIQLGVLALVILALALFVLRPMLTSAQTRESALPAPDDTAADLPELPPLPPLPGMDAGTLGDLPALGDFADSDGLEEDDPVQRLRRLIEDRQEETVEILRGWMEDIEEERA